MPQMKMSQLKMKDRAGDRSRLLSAATALTATALLAGMLAGILAATVAPAYADVTSSTYTIGSPTSAVTDVVASPSGATASTSTNFEVSFSVVPALSGNSSDWVSVIPSSALLTTPASIALVGSSCVQSGVNGGSSSPTGLTVKLTTSCSLASGTQAKVYFTAETPATTGDLTFTVTTSANSTPATSNAVAITTAGPVLSAATYAAGANTTYSISPVDVANLTSGGTTLKLVAQNTHGSGTIGFVNSGAGAAGYSVTDTPSGGSATSDTVTNAAASGATVTLTLTSPLADGDTVQVTATGTNPGSTSANDVVVEPGNGTDETTNSVEFGSSVTAVSVAPSSLVAGGPATYSVGFTASSAVAAGGDLYLSEPGGPTDFATVTGIEVIDNTQHQQFVASGASLSASGSATVPVADAIAAGDSVSVLMLGVTNPSSPGTISDFSVSTTGDPVGADAPAYTIVANASPGVVVTVNPTTTGAVATYTIANIRASSTLTGGTSTFRLEAPSGTVFPNNASYYSVNDSTSASGSGTVSAPLVGGGTNDVTFIVPKTVSSGDVLTITVADVVNPSTASSSDEITVVGNVTGPAASAATTTTAPAPTTTTRPPVKKVVHHPAVADLTSKATVSKRHVVDLELKCTVEACKGTVTLVDVTDVVGAQSYSLRAGKKGVVAVHLKPKGILFLAGAKKHTIKVTATVTVHGGKTVKERTTLVG
jgi:hypothetical protein